MCVSSSPARRYPSYLQIRGRISNRRDGMFRNDFQHPVHSSFCVRLIGELAELSTDSVEIVRKQSSCSARRQNIFFYRLYQYTKVVYRREYPAVRLCGIGQEGVQKNTNKFKFSHKEIESKTISQNLYSLFRKLHSNSIDLSHHLWYQCTLCNFGKIGDLGFSSLNFILNNMHY